MDAGREMGLSVILKSSIPAPSEEKPSWLTKPPGPRLFPVLRC